MPHLLHSVVIATCGRGDLFERALTSISRQSVLPDRVVVVDDRCTADLNELQNLGNRLDLPLEVLANRRTKGASGAWNTGLDHLTRSKPDLHGHIVSILDDDDWWDTEYVRHVQSAFKSGADIVAACVFRRDETTPGGRLCPPPTVLRADDFLIGNPGIQGSNLSVRLSTMLMAGLFDEALPSCTDRDICIRLADLRPIFQAVPDAIAHHDTLHGLPRLSDRAGRAKRRGLDAFHAKWRLRMTDEQLLAFADRARQFFDWLPALKSPVERKNLAEQRRAPAASNALTLVVGIIADGSNPQRCRPLLDGLSRLANHSAINSLDVVLLENGDAAGYRSIIEHGCTLGLHMWGVDLDAQSHVAAALPLRKGDVTRAKSIAVARTLLQRFVFQISQERKHAMAWILDDDFRVPADIEALARAIVACRDSGIHVALGGNSGSAPVPASSLLRTQLVDLVHFLRCAGLRKPGDTLPNADDANQPWLRERTDYHYDLTRGHTDRLETPFLPHFQGETFLGAVGEALRRADRILAGEAISRPVQPASDCAPEQAPDSCLRGGNTLILDTTLLRDIPNMSPRIGVRPTRRSDMIWAANARYLFGRTVKSVCLPMIHDRSTERADEDDRQRLIDDIIGYGFFRAYEFALRAQSRAPGTRFTAEEYERINRDIRKFTQERLAAYRLSFWRSVGLTQTLKNMIAEQPWWIDLVTPEDRSAFFRFLGLLEQATDLSHLHYIEDGVQAGLQTGEFSEFLGELDEIRPERSAPEIPFLELWSKRGREERARSLLCQYLGISTAGLLGMGAEGVVLRAGDRVVKIFDGWAADERQSATPILKNLCERRTDGALPDVIAVHDWPEAQAVEYRYEDSQPYSGGHGPELIAMLRDLRRCGWVHSNLSPKNIRITTRGLQLIDIGKSLEHATRQGEEMMVRRAFLSWRFADREDLATLMRASLRTEGLPELTGWRALSAAVECSSSKERLDQLIKEEVDSLAPRTVLDYGCGKPRKMTWPAEASRMTAFDIDPGLHERWLREAPDIAFWNEEQLQNALTEDLRFDVIVCSLVLCAVDDATMAKILGDIRQLIGPNGRVLVSVCDPAAFHVTHALDQTRFGTRDRDALLPCRYWKSVGASSNRRLEFHRSTAGYRRAFAKAGLRITEESAVTGFDAEHLEQAPEFLVFELAPLPKLQDRTSLLIKVCALDAETTLHQVRHLVRQLGCPRAFDEVVLLVDPHKGTFPRAHCYGDLAKLRQATERLLEEGVVDRVVDGFADGAAAAGASFRSTGCLADHAHCRNGQPATSILAAFEACSGDYILHCDVDVLVGRPDTSFDHIGDAIAVFEENPDAVTLTLPVLGDTDSTPRRVGTDGLPYRVEAMVGWIARSRLLSLWPLPGGAAAGRLNQPWHRMLDIAVRQGRAASLRCGSRAIWFAAPDNSRKSEIDDHLLLLDRVEAGQAPAIQMGKPLIQGTMDAWLGPKRPESMVVIICGRNVRPGAIARCLDSLRMQSFREWGAIVMDDASDDGSSEVLGRVCRGMTDRMTLVRRRRRVGLLANTFLAVRHMITRPDAVVVLLDLDDALADAEALAIVAEQHEAGADLTVGSMVRTDKVADYPVDFDNPREKRGGNVWQHLRTFRKSLFDRIALDDLKLNGQWIDLANDWAYMLPIAEMARNPVWVKERLYLHEPSTCRPAEEKAERETVIARIVAKPSYIGRQAISPQVTVMCYHRVLESIPETGPDALFHKRGMAVSSGTLLAQVRSALRHFEPIRAVDLLAAQRGEMSLPRNALLVTFDDGYRDFATTALPLLTQLGIEPILFPRLPSADGFPSWAPLDLLYLGRGAASLDSPLPSMEWRENLMELPLDQQLDEVQRHMGPASCGEVPSRQATYLSESEILSLQNVVVGTHGKEHVRWTTLSDRDLDTTLTQCRAWLDRAGGVPVAACPDGIVDGRVATRLAAAGYQSAFTLETSVLDVPHPLAVRRIVMPDDGGYVDKLIDLQQEDAA